MKPHVAARSFFRPGVGKHVRAGLPARVMKPPPQL